jgi:hypothetical protein
MRTAMRAELISAEKFPARLKEAQQGNRHVRVALVASSWRAGRELLAAVKGGDGSDVERDFRNCTVRVLPGPGCVKGDFLTRDEFDEVYVVPDGIPLLDAYRLVKNILGLK